MRIAITGSHGVGKTTLCRDILSELNAEQYKTKEDLMKLAVTGSHGTGKTTLSKLLAGKQNFHYLPEAPFQAFQAGFPMNEESSLETEMWIFAKQLEMERAKPDNWVADKCMIDLLAYAHYFLGSSQEFGMFVKVARPAIAKYDRVFYLPTGQFPIEDDGFRSMDPKFQQTIDLEIRNIMDLYAVDYHMLIGTPTERLARAREVIAGRGV